MKKRKAKDFIALYAPEDEEKLVLIQDGISADKTFLDTFWTAHTHALAMADVKTGQVTYAVRDTQLNGEEIKKGDILGMVNGELSVSGKEVDEVCKKTIDKTLDLGGESITLFYGEDVTQEQADALAEELEAEYPDCDVQMYPGGQSLYYYIVGVE